MARISRHGARLLAPEDPPREQPRRNMASAARPAIAVHGPRRTGVGYAGDVRAAERRKGRPDTEPRPRCRATPDGEQRLIAHAQRSAVADGRRRLRGDPWQGWKDILWRAYEKMNDNRLLAVAAGVVFYALLALFPAVTRIRIAVWPRRRRFHNRPICR